MNNDQIAYCKIFPPIGIARVGDSMEADGYFFAPEKPGDGPRQAVEAKSECAFKYRDASGAVKRQAALFHIYAFDASDQPLGELVDGVDGLAHISWSVQLANKKAAWFNFSGAHGARNVFEAKERPLDIGEKLVGLRNKDVGKVTREAGGPHGHSFVSDADRKATLEIVGAKRLVSGVSQRHADGKSDLNFVGTFRHKHEVYLGELATDPAGRLIVLGGRGVSAPVNRNGTLFDDPTEAWITHYANNNDWFDDTSDGPVSAEVTLKAADGAPDRKIEVRGSSWVVVAPPDFAPDTTNLVTLYDVMEEVAHDAPGLVNATTPGVSSPSAPDLKADIWPIIERSSGYRWVSKLGLRGHGKGRPGDALAGNTVAYEKFHDSVENSTGIPTGIPPEKLFSVLRPPIYKRPNGHKASDEDMAIANAAATTFHMPPLSGDEGDRETGDATTWLSLTHLQYERMKVWSKNPTGKGVAPNPQTLPELPDNSTHPSVITRTILEACCGGAFYPGIEVTSIVRDPKLYQEAFRFDSEVLAPGDVTKYMALPWQADFYECRDAWWPAQRPDDVIHEDSFKEMFDEFGKAETMAESFEKTLGERLEWARGVGSWKQRPGTKFLASKVLPPVDEKETFERYAVRVAEGWRNSIKRAVPNEQGVSPWRQRYLLQEACDRYSGRCFQPVLPDVDEGLDIARLKLDHPDLVSAFNICTVSDLRRCWRDAVRLNQETVTKSIEALEAHCAAFMQHALDAYLVKIIMGHPFVSRCKDKDPSPIDFRAELTGPKSSLNDLAEDPKDIPYGSESFFDYALREARDAMTDAAYVRHCGRNGDNAMVQDWRHLGFVVKKSLPLANGDTLSVHVETERDKYHGSNFRDKFYFLLNIQDHPDFMPEAVRIVDEVLHIAAKVIKKTGIEDPEHPESFVPYSQPTFRAKLEEVYEIQRSSAQNYDIYYAACSRNVESTRRGLLDMAPFNQCDGAWLRGISSAGPSDDVRALLFEVWSDEIGNGNPLLHHGNLYTSLLNSHGIHTHELTSRAYADDPKINENNYVSPVFQLAISQHSDLYFPELLGMTLYLEWEVLSLVPSIKTLDYLGIDSHFWQMHVGIDNATNGHGAKARDAVMSYLDHIRHDGGNEAVQEHWARIWRGYVAFIISMGSKFFKDDFRVMRRRPGNAADKLSEVITRKSNYGALNHMQHRIGDHRINDLFDDPDLFQRMMAESKWIVAGDPDKSVFLNHLTTFQGPMYQIFDAPDLAVWRAWVEWLGRDGDTAQSKRYFDKGQAMEALLIEMKSIAQGVNAHSRYRAGSGSHSKSIADWFASNDIRGFMKALRDGESGWVVKGNPAASPLVADFLRGSNLMGKALDRRFPAINNRIGRQIVIEWVRAACPIPDEVESAAEDRAPALKSLGRRLYMHTLGTGAVH